MIHFCCCFAIRLFGIYMYKPFPPRAKPTRKIEQQQEKRLRRQPPPHLNSPIEGRKDQPIPRNMEEKYIYNVRRSPADRSSSIAAPRKHNTHSTVNEEYRPIKLARPQQQTDRLQEQPSLQLGCNSREHFRKEDKTASRVRLMRVRSNDSINRLAVGRQRQTENQLKLQSLKDQNTYLQQLHSQSLKKIIELQQIKTQQEGAFEGEKKVYEKQMELLRARVQRNKVDIGHLFSYDNFDPNTLLVKPIPQVEENSSIMKSLYNTRSAIRKPSIDSEYGFAQRNRKIPTETTAFSSEHLHEARELF